MSQDTTKTKHGTYTAIARKLGLSPAYVGMVARGERRNARVEELLLKAAAEERRAERRRRRLQHMSKPEHE